MADKLVLDLETLSFVPYRLAVQKAHRTQLNSASEAASSSASRVPLNSPRTPKMSNEARQRLRPWLQSILDNGQVPGVRWTDREAGVFMLPWKHAGKQDWSETDSLIFKEWALHTGKFRPGIDKEDWSVWKTRMRCALNKLSDIEEMRDKSRLEEPHPYRVYRFLPITAESIRTKKKNSKVQIVSEEVRQQVNYPQLAENVPTFVTGQTVDKSLDDSDGVVAMEVDQAAVGTARPVSEYGLGEKADLVVDDQSYPTDVNTGAPMVQFAQQIQPHAATAEQRPQQEVTGDQLSLRVRYRRREVFERSVQKSCCRLYHGPEASSMLGSTGVEIFGPREAEQVRLPATADVYENEPKVQMLLNVLDRGLVLEVIDGDLYATRLCRCVIFVQSSSLGTTVPKRLERNKGKEKIFDFRAHFLPELRRWCEGGMAAPRPSADVLISCGQQWDPRLQDVHDLFISATVTHVPAHNLLQQVTGSTRTGCSLQISSADSFDNFVDEVKQVEMGNFCQTLTATP